MSKLDEKQTFLFANIEVQLQPIREWMAYRKVNNNEQGVS